MTFEPKPIDVMPPDHPSPTEIARAEWDVDLMLSEMTVDFFEMDRLASAELGIPVAGMGKLVVRLLGDMLGKQLEHGIAHERVRMAGYLLRLSQRARSNGSPTRARAIGEMAGELLASLEDGNLRKGIHEALRRLRQETGG